MRPLNWLRISTGPSGVSSGVSSWGKLGSDPRKVLLADLLWRRTLVSQVWLAAKLETKSAVNLSQQVRRLDRKDAIKKVPDN